MNIEKIVIGSDHAGYKLKEALKEYLKSLNYEITDVGVYDENAADYPVIARKAAQVVSSNPSLRGVLICGSGVGMSISANKIKGIRAVVCSDSTTAKFSRLHNDSNILCLGQRIVGEYLAKDILKTWLDTPFEQGRHQFRVDMIEII